MEQDRVCLPVLFFPTGEMPLLPLSSGSAMKKVAATAVSTGSWMGAPWFASPLALLAQGICFQSWEEEPSLEARVQLSPTCGCYLHYGGSSFTSSTCHCRLRACPTLANGCVAFCKGLEYADLAAPLGSLEYWIAEQITGKYLDTSAHKQAFSQLFHTGIQYLIKPWAENSSSELKNHHIKDSAGFWLLKGKRVLYHAKLSSLLLGVGLLGLPYFLSPLKFPMSPL